MTLPPAVLINGSLAVVRSLGRHGVETQAVSGLPWTSLKHSRYASGVRKAPAWSNGFGEWFERQEWTPGSVVIPEGDDAAWWLGKRSDSHPDSGIVGATPGLAPVRTMLIKHRMTELARAHGIATPRTWVADTAAFPQRSEVTFPAVVKPQCRVGLQHWTRGRVVRNERELDAALQWFRAEAHFDPAVVADDSSIVHPLVQEFISRPSHEVYHLVGYRSRAGEVVFAAHRKLLQYPMRFGSGLCFESTDVDSGEASKIEQLLADIEFHGIFEAEYLERDGQKLLIDLNPRSYNGISLETQRGYDLPWYLYLDTIGDFAGVSGELAKARALNPPSLVWCDNVRFWTMLAGQTLSGGLPLAETRRWLAWSWHNRHRTIDPFFEPGDRRPGFAFLGEHVASAVREPRALLGTYFRRGLDR